MIPPKNKKGLKASESQVQKAILDYLKLKKIFFWRNNTGGFSRNKHYYQFGSVGSPDIFALYNGKIVGIECKASEGEILSDSQKQWGNEFVKHGGRYFVVRSLDELIKKL